MSFTGIPCYYDALFFCVYFQLELFCSVNVLQFIFLALRLDHFTQWSWEVVFVPLWIVMCLSLVSVLYTIIFAGILIKTPEVNARQRRTSFNAALGYTLLVVPILVFQVSATLCVENPVTSSGFNIKKLCDSKLFVFHRFY